MTDNRKEITKDLSERLERYINPKGDTRIYYAKEVTFDYGTIHSVRVDYMQFEPVSTYSPGGLEKGKFKAYEIKSCMEDFKSGHGLNFIADYNYLVMPKDLYEQLKSQSILKYYNVGVLIPKEDTLWCVKKPKETVRKYSFAEMLFCMFRSANRENIKRTFSSKEPLVLCDEYGLSDYWEEN